VPPAPELEYRLRQQALLAELGRRALADTTLDIILGEAARLTALGLDPAFCKVLEYLPEQNRLLVRAGVGWHEGVVGVATVGADLASPAGYAMHTGKPVIANRLREEQRFRTPELLAEHGIERAINVILMGEGRPFGVLEADGRTEGAFSEHDIDFMQGVANLLGVAIDHHRTLATLQQLNASLEERVESEIAARRQTETVLHQAQKMEAVGQLTGGIAHDFNNLLTVVAGNLDLIATRVKGDAELERMIAAAQKGATRGRQLTSQLLAFARRQTLHPEIRSINDLVQEFDVLASRILGEMVEMEFDLDPHAGTTHVDPAQFGSALLNLVVNARDAMPRGGKVTIGTGRVTLDRHAAARIGPDAVPGSYVTVTVTDTGSGMTPEVLVRALEPFFSTKDAGKGTGLGLSQVYGFTRQSGGFLSIDSAEGMGTEVSIYLPASGATVLAGGARTADSAVLIGSETLLVVEDDEDVRTLMIDSLTDLGYRVLIARNAPDALAVLEQRSEVDLVVTDVVMPGGMTGVELVREARRRRGGMRALLVSGYTAGNELVRGNGDTDDLPLLGKPFRQPELARAIRAALDQGRNGSGG
jgi:signal transduction histidine kinase/CheY-like chemotaxis protein